MLNMEDLYRLLRTEHVQAQGIVDTVADPLLVLDSSLCIQSASRAFYETFGVERYDTIGRKLYELGNGQWDIPELQHLLVDVIPKATAVIDFEVQHDFPGLGYRTMLVTARTLHHPDSGSQSMLLVIVDATERTRRDEAKDLLFGELRHRTKNMFAMVQALANRTSTIGRSADEYREAFLGRLNALADAQDFVFTDQGETGLKALIERILAPYARRSAVVIEPGPMVEMPSRMATSMGLLLHELATNAVKYGALSTDGQVRISWQLDDGSRLQLNWIETDGPPVTPPVDKGFGTHLINSLVRYSLKVHLEQTYAAKGLQVEVVVPLGRDLCVK